MSFNTRKEVMDIVRRERGSFTFEGVTSMTEQAHADLCDVHLIMKRFERTQMCDHVSAFSGEYGDYIGAEDFHASMNKIAEAESMFETIPSGIRAKFGHDPARFLEWIQDEKNRAEILELGFTDLHLPSVNVPEDSLEGSGSKVVASSGGKSPVKKSPSESKSEPVKGGSENSD